MNLKLRFISVFILLNSFGCGVLSQKTDLDYIQEAKQSLDNERFDEALSTLQNVKQETEEVVQIKASALVGKGGFRILNITDNVLLNKFIYPAYIILFKISRVYQSNDIDNTRKAEKILEEFSKNHQISKETMFFQSLIFFYKASQILSKNSDINSQGPLSPNWDPCEESQFPSADIRETIVSLNKGAKLLASIKRISSADPLSDFFNILLEIPSTGVVEFILNENEVIPQKVVEYRNFLNKEVLSKTNICY